MNDGPPIWVVVAARGWAEVRLKYIFLVCPITGEVRALYLEHEDRVIFGFLGTRSQVYG
jgi:hypothetical protein